MTQKKEDELTNRRGSFKKYRYRDAMRLALKNSMTVISHRISSRPWVRQGLRLKLDNSVCRAEHTLHSESNSNSCWWSGVEAVSSTNRTLLGHVHLRLVGRLDSLRAFLPPLPLFLSAELLAPVELLFFLPFLTTSHFPTEPLFEAIFYVPKSRVGGSWGVLWLPTLQRNRQSPPCKTAGGAAAYLWLGS